MYNFGWSECEYQWVMSGTAAPLDASYEQQTVQCLVDEVQWLLYESVIIDSDDMRDLLK